ncbi:putative polysaccharide biosynthesis protein [Clostridium sp. L2-50]|jgi:stage V sporulation protein B|uniref:putative polysaccharide biosynthesis protein n=1 Tax=Clostridium sp. L2-50 TaxID=411489 RepID=UPI00015BD9DA|nr:polysaccharide biosynthesis protein [Clostridium sp. L2-50]EDO57027.1 polysaccharide biosynthesis protein [Clostridium sp. L2-50]UEA74923.1 polysaccharide biosynthesis protein [Lachnospiraceae bacterium GAM79]UEA78117.1 polysaccharide biosynthesis protein [Lachnospiraceae bacterium GAM79]
MQNDNGKKKIKKPSGMRTNFAFQAAVLAGAGILSRVIGLLYRSPLFQIIGDEGNGYYGTAYAIYSMILMIATYSIPTAVSKIISGKLALGEYRNARRVFKCAFIYVVSAGLVAGILTFAFAPVLVKEQPNAILSLQILAPTIFLSGFLAIYRGYLQAYKTMIPTSISQIIEQIANAVVSVLAAHLMSRPFAPGTSEHAKYGAAGSAMGTGAGVLCGIIYILIAYAGRRKEIMETVETDVSSNVESYGKLFRQIVMIVTPIIIAAFVYNITTTVDMKIFYNVLNSKNVDRVESANLYGIFSGQYMVLINLPVSIASAVGTTLIPNISGAFTKGDKEETNHVYNQSMSITMMVTIPCAVGIGVLSEPIITLLFRGADPLVFKALTAGCISVVFYSLSTLTNSILQGIGKVMEPVKNATLALLIHLVFLAAILKFTDAKLFGLVAATILYSLLACIFNHISVSKYMSTKLDVKKIYLAPAVASIFMGIVAWGSYQIFYHLIHMNSVSVVLAILLAVIFYAAAILAVGGYTKEEILAMPKGTLILKLAEKLHLVRE